MLTTCDPVSLYFLFISLFFTSFYPYVVEKLIVYQHAHQLFDELPITGTC
ncbi:hypothetical protein HanRHA438_Chr07g0301721 [Helianthus annuus]|nr:hypothetical protein HanHA300_Chr07g0239451 [Helianthus annuus]KAJ0562872.1 hypothetical protein HanHA89_Chr07g0256691 [Helianthus annuus]KAJ0731010.1 hypothetical protein HanOQP8_Chr07g0247061 [Helianthus annuus]KAJ0907662.1 hypothetical protein HanRHA438_Chr07g0301721 [Helianthus annuus]